MRRVEAFNQELREAGAWVFAGGLHGPDTATVLRPTDGDVLITDGPYAEGKEFARAGRAPVQKTARVGGGR